MVGVVCLLFISVTKITDVFHHHYDVTPKRSIVAPRCLAIIQITFLTDLGVAMPVVVCQAFREHQHQFACLLSIEFIKQFEELLLWVALATLWLEGEEFLNAVGCVGDGDRVSSLCLRYNYGTPAGVLQGGLCHLFN